MRDRIGFVTTAAVILAAGASTRFGSPKQLALYQGTSLLERAVRTAREAGCSPVIVVLGANSEAIARGCDLAETQVCLNDQWREGMASSVRVGIAAAGAAEGALVLTCDMPMVTAVHLRALMTAGVVTASRYANRKGVPAFFPADAFPALLGLEGDAGAREMLQTAGSIELAGGDLDVDTPEDLEHGPRLV